MSATEDELAQHTQQTLRKVAHCAQVTKSIALDTEFIGEGRYRTLLCLIQVAMPNGDSRSQIEIIDPLVEGLDYEPFAKVLADPQIELVLHAGRQDIALLRRHLSTDIHGVFDTQVAAGFLGLPAQSSYEALLAQLLGVKLAKSASFTRWDARPLSAEQLLYAHEDVLHLLELAGELKRRLAKLGRLEWARQECRPLEDVSDERKEDEIFARLPRIYNLSSTSQATARELVDWREELARRDNRPVQRILADAVLIEIAKRQPKTIPELRSIRGTSNFGQAKLEVLLARVKAGQTRTHEPLPKPPRLASLDSADAPLLALAEALVQTRAREADLAYELIASRADLRVIVGLWRREREEARVRTLQGWRRELVGAELLELIDGHRTLSVKDGRVVVVS
jgi:ribonuclease D